MTPRQQLDALVNLFAPRIRAAFLAAIADVVDNVILLDVIKAIQNGDVEGAFRALGFSDAAMRPLVAVIEQAYERGGVLTGATFPKYLNTTSGRAVFRFDVRNSRAEAYLREKSSTLITKISTDTMTNVRTALTEGMKAGINPRTVALDIVGRVDKTTGKRTGGLVGLTAQQEGWVRSARTRLEDLDDAYFGMGLRDKRFDSTVAKAIREGKPLPAATVEKLTIAYKTKALKYRGDMIGRTEALQSLNASEYEATLQAHDLGAMKAEAVQREWDDTGDKRTRHTHRLMNGQRVGLHEAFISPSGVHLLYPGDTSNPTHMPEDMVAAEVIACRCRAKSVIDWLADLD